MSALDEVSEDIADIRAAVVDVLSILDELFPEDAPLPPRTTEHRMYSEDRGY